MFATNLARLVSVPTFTSFVSLASAAQALLICHCSANVHRFEVTFDGRLWRDISGLILPGHRCTQPQVVLKLWLSMSCQSADRQLLNRL